MARLSLAAWAALIAGCMHAHRPINMGVQLVPRGRYQQAIAVLDAVCEVYPFNESFIAGQVRPCAPAQGVLCTLVLCLACCCEASPIKSPRFPCLLLGQVVHYQQSGQVVHYQQSGQVVHYQQSGQVVHYQQSGQVVHYQQSGLQLRVGSCHTVSCLATRPLMCAPTTLGRRAAQLALASYLGVLNNEAALLGHLDAAIGGGRSCLAVPLARGGAGAVCLLPCHRWNYCHDDQSCCTSPGRLPLGLTSRGALERAGTAVLHQARAFGKAPADAQAAHVCWTCKQTRQIGQSKQFACWQSHPCKPAAGRHSFLACH